MTTFIKVCLENNKGPFLTAIIIGGICMVVTLTLTWRHTQKISERPLCLLRAYYNAVFVFPSVWAVSALISLLCPNAAPLAELAQGQSEAFTIYMFLTILYMLLSREATKQEMEGGDSSAEVQVGPAIVTALEQQGPKPYFATPPFFCCCAGIFPKHLLTPRHFLRIIALVKQYIYMQLFFSVFGLWAEMSLDEHLAHKISTWTKIILKVSGMIGIYGLFVMYKATHDILEHWNTTRKFIAIKFVILLSIVQNRLLGFLLQKFRRKDQTCLVSTENPHDLSHVTNFWAQFLLVCETILMVYLLSKAFPAEEVEDFRIHHLDVVELELQQMNKREKGYKETEEGGASSSDELSADEI